MSSKFLHAMNNHGKGRIDPLLRPMKKTRPKHVHKCYFAKRKDGTRSNFCHVCGGMKRLEE